MEADWDIEIGPELPSIDVPWEGFVDLRNHANLAAKEIPEVAAHPALFNALISLNSRESPVLTSKCDIWWIKQEEIDAWEFSARPENARRGFASYVDVLLLKPEQFRSFQFHELWVRRTTEDLQTRVLAHCRVDLVVRPATFHATSGCGLTVYASGCGKEEHTAYAAWEAVLEAAVNATMKMVDLPSTRASSSIG
jgi:hypothetical protein